MGVYSESNYATQLRIRTRLPCSRCPETLNCVPPTKSEHQAQTEYRQTISRCDIQHTGEMSLLKTIPMSTDADLRVVHFRTEADGHVIHKSTSIDELASATHELLLYGKA